MSVNQHLQGIRQELKRHDLTAVIIPSTDPHMGEYIPEHWNERAWVSGFTGSAGTLVITLDFAGLWTDSRYFLQAREELSGSDIQLMELRIPHTPEHLDWITDQLPANSRIGVCGRMISASMANLISKQLGDRQMEVVTQVDVVTPVWTDRPPLPTDPVFELDVQYTGETRPRKLARIRELMKTDRVSHYLVCTLDEIAWITNLRGSDVPFNPLFVSYMLISHQTATLYMSPGKIDSDLMLRLEEDGIRIRPYEAIADDLRQLKPDTVLAFDPGKTNQALAAAVPEEVVVKHLLGYATSLKAVKNDTEIRNLKETMRKDGVAWVKFLHWLDTRIGKETITELRAAEKLDRFRAEQEGYRGRSFYPISSYKHHGAVVHYAVSQESDLELEPEGIYLCDTGGHYLGGTTDTTRTVALGPVTAQQKADFTLALKGTLGVSMLRFPAGTKGFQMDILARKALWDHGMNFGHGTGHGVGFYLNVHEGPQTIGSGATGHMQTAFEPGMVTTVEPGLYREGLYGIRTENMTLCVPQTETAFGVFLTFETITLVHVDRRLLDVTLLTDEEITWLNDYHQEVFTQLRPYLNDQEATWLKIMTQPIQHGTAD